MLKLYFRFLFFVWYPIYIMGRVDAYYPLRFDLITLLEIVLAGLIGYNIYSLFTECYSKGQYDKDMQYAGTD
jgi:hypothetical protein